MDGMMIVGVVALLNSPFYAIVIHNAVQTRVNRKLLERLNGINRDEQNEKEEENAEC